METQSTPNSVMQVTKPAMNIDKVMILVIEEDQKQNNKFLKQTATVGTNLQEFPDKTFQTLAKNTEGEDNNSEIQEPFNFNDYLDQNKTAENFKQYRTLDQISTKKHFAKKSTSKHSSQPSLKDENFQTGLIGSKKFLNEYSLLNSVESQPALNRQSIKIQVNNDIKHMKSRIFEQEEEGTPIQPSENPQSMGLGDSKMFTYYSNFKQGRQGIRGQIMSPDKSLKMSIGKKNVAQVSQQQFYDYFLNSGNNSQVGNYSHLNFQKHQIQQIKFGEQLMKNTIISQGIKLNKIPTLKIQPRNIKDKPFKSRSNSNINSHELNYTQGSDKKLKTKMVKQSMSPSTIEVKFEDPSDPSPETYKMITSTVKLRQIAQKSKSSIFITSENVGSASAKMSQILNLQFGSSGMIIHDSISPKPRREKSLLSDRDQIGKTLQNSNTHLHTSKSNDPIEEDHDTPKLKNSSSLAHVDFEVRQQILGKRKMNLESIASQIAVSSNNQMSKMSPKYKERNRSPKMVSSPSGDVIGLRYGAKHFEKRKPYDLQVIQFKEFELPKDMPKSPLKQIIKGIKPKPTVDINILKQLDEIIENHKDIHETQELESAKHVSYKNIQSVNVSPKISFRNAQSNVVDEEFKSFQNSRFEKKQLFQQIKKQQEVELEAIKEKMKMLKKDKKNDNIQKLRIDVQKINSNQDVETVFQKSKLEKKDSLLVNSEQGEQPENLTKTLGVFTAFNKTQADYFENCDGESVNTPFLYKNKYFEQTQESKMAPPSLVKATEKQTMTIFQEKKNSFIEKQTKKQEYFKERFNNSIMKMNATKRQRFNQTTQLPKKIQKINLPKNLDKISLEYQFTSSNRMKDNILIQKNQQSIMLNPHIHQMTKNLENKDEIMQIIKNATIEKMPMVKRVQNQYRSRSTLNQTQQIRPNSLLKQSPPPPNFEEISVKGLNTVNNNNGISTRDLNSPIFENTQEQDETNDNRSNSSESIACPEKLQKKVNFKIDQYIQIQEHKMKKRQYELATLTDDYNEKSRFEKTEKNRQTVKMQKNIEILQKIKSPIKMRNNIAIHSPMNTDIQQILENKSVFSPKNFIKRNSLQSKPFKESDIVEKDILQFKNNKLLF